MQQIGYLIPSKKVAMTESDELAVIKPITEINLNELSGSFDFIVSFSIILDITKQSATIFKLCFEDPDGNELKCEHFIGEGEPKSVTNTDEFFQAITLEVPFSVEPAQKGIHFVVLEAIFDFDDEKQITDSKRVPILVIEDKDFHNLLERDGNEA